jgi:hypothetical protein
MEVDEDSTTSMNDYNKETDSPNPSQHLERASMEVEESSTTSMNNDNKDKADNLVTSQQHWKKSCLEVEEDSATSMNDNNKEAENSDPSQHPEKASMEVERRTRV